MATLQPSQTQTIELEGAVLTMTLAAKLSDIDWKQRCDQLEFEHQLDLERIRLHYDHELKEKVAEIRLQLKREYDYQFSEFRNHLLEQQQMIQNTSSPNLNLDQSLGEQVREQVRLAQEFDRHEDEQRQQLLSQSSVDNDELKRLVNKLHNEGVHVLTLSELLSLRLNGINIGSTDDSISSYQKLHEENTLLRSLIGNMNGNAGSHTLIQCLADIFRCEQERRSLQICEHKNLNHLEEEIQDMCDYQRDALGKLLSQDRVALIQELDNTRKELEYLKAQFEKLKLGQQQSTGVHSHHLNKFYGKYLRCEAHRKALVYQKRYLLVLLTGYQDTETFALHEIRRLTGESSPKSSIAQFSYEKMKLIPRRTYLRRTVDNRFRFRCYVTVVIAMLRLRWLARKWALKMSTIR